MSLHPDEVAVTVHHLTQLLKYRGLGYQSVTVNEAIEQLCGLLKERADAQERLESSVECLREIAAMGKKAGSETAQHWLLQHGYPLEDGGYVPGAQGFGDAR